MSFLRAKERAALPRFCFVSRKSPMQWRTAGMTVAAAYLIALALTLLILVMIWEGLS